MKSFYLIIFTVFTTLVANAQWRWDFGGSIGAANYLGDIGGRERARQDGVNDMQLAKSRWAVGGFARYKMAPKFYVKMGLEYLRIEGSDQLSTNPARNARNLNFRNDMLDLGVTGQLVFFEDLDLGNTYKFRNSFRSYVFAGVGGYYSNPKASIDGGFVALQPLHTEGVSYSKFGVSLPIGVGFYFTLMKKHRLGFDINYRLTFSDYLDDVSGNYPTDPSQTGNPNLSLRTPELGTVSTDEGFNKSFDWGQKRGDNTRNDAFLTMNISYSIVLRGQSSYYKGHYKGFFKHRGGKVRKVRAKF